jgi:uncharacterized membrane protein
LRIADRITAFAGSMNFVCLHVAVFALWMPGSTPMKLRQPVGAEPAGSG